MTPLIIPAAQAAAGLYQTLFSGRGKAIKQLEQMANRNPVYSGSKSISDYYQEAKDRYNVSPYNSAQYQTAARDAMRGTATAINALQDRRSALGGVGRIVAGQTDQLQRAGAQAEALRNQKFGQYGTAAGMKGQDDLRKFQYNELDPYNRRFNLQSMKAGQASATRDAGLSNLYGGLSNASLLMSGIKKRNTPLPANNFDYLQSIGD